MRNYRKQKVDANQTEIIQHIRQRGGHVEILGDPVDIIASLRGAYWGFIEIKIPGSAAKFTRTQLQFLARTPMPAAIVKTGDEAMQFLTTGNGLTERQKYFIGKFLSLNEGNYFTPAKIAEVMG